MQLDMESSKLYNRRNHKDYVTSPTSLKMDTPPALPPKLRQSLQKDLNSIAKITENMICSRCREGFKPEEKIINVKGKVWHEECFVCAQCFQQFPDGVFFEFEERMYCESDFHKLYVPICGACGHFVLGRVIKAMNRNWHPQCFVCKICSKSLADHGFIKSFGRALCTDCNNKEKLEKLGKYICFKCHDIIDEGHLKYKGETYHPYHFNCYACNVELNSNARIIKGELHCLRCHDKMGVPICGACHMPIEDRAVYALGKHWHVQHFVCSKCEKPFLGHQHYERRGHAYCETHYHQLFGSLCFFCNKAISGTMFSAMNKAWCVEHFACVVCDKTIGQKTKFYEFDMKPVCKKCYEKFPTELRTRLKNAHKTALKNKMLE